MNESLTTTVRIPNNLDLDLIFNDVQGNKTKIQYLKDGSVYLISLLTVDNYNYVNLKDGYTPLSGKILSEIIGDKRPTEIVKILLGKGVIEIRPHSQGHFSRRYRLTEHYNTGLFTEVELSERIKTKIHQHKQHNHIELGERINYIQDRQLNGLTDINLDQQYSFIFDQFKENDLCIDIEKGDLFVRNLGMKLLQKTILLNKNRGFVLKSVFNYIGRMYNQLEDFNEKKYNLNLFNSNHRFHSTLTSLPKVLRPFLKINGNNVGEVDISNSHSYILSTILNQEFTISDLDGYNIHTIYEDLNKDFNSTKYIIPSNKKGNNRYVLGVHMSEDEYNGLNKFTTFDFSTDFYEYILNEGLLLSPEYLKQKKGFSFGRNYIKDNIMNFLFDSYDFRRENNNVIESLQVIIRNDIYLGFNQYIDKKTKLTIKNNIPQLITNKLWDEVQERKKLKLLRKNQLNRTKKFYLFRDFLICNCGTPMGGRIKPEKCIQHYYCPLSERKFNNSYKKDNVCEMKKCLNIPTTDKVLWETIVDVLRDTNKIKDTLKDKTLIGKSLNSKEIKKITKIKEDRITDLTKTKNDLEKGLVGIETDNILNNFPSDEVYKSLKKDLTRRYHQTLSEIEEIRNTLRQIGDDIKWLDSIDTFGKQIQEKRDIPDPMKKELLKSILENIKVEYDHIVKVHRLTINFKIPVLIGDEGSSLTTRIEVKPPKSGRKTLVKPKDQIDPVRDYSTVTDFARFLG